MSSLSAPWDRTEEDEKYVAKQIVLTEDEAKSALTELNRNEFVSKFPRVDKFYADPQIDNQAYCLHSFVPSKGATPDDHGVYGFIKFRGSFASQREADERAEFLVRNVDTFHDIYTSYCGRPFPISSNKDFVKETNIVDINTQTVSAAKEDVKSKVANDRKIKDEINEREKKLLIESSSEEPSGDRYITLQVKRANLVHVYVESMKTIKNIKDAILKCRAEIAELEATSPESRVDYIERYNAARQESGLDFVQNDKTYLQYMGLDDTDILGF